MQGFKSQGSQKPTAMGTLLQSSAYGATIPTIYGQTQSAPLAIWAANLRQGSAPSLPGQASSGKKFKQMKKGQTNYVENVDFLIAHSPVMGILQILLNGQLNPLNFTSQSFTASGGRQSFAVTDAHFCFVAAVTLTVGYSLLTDDFGGQGAETLIGSYELPLWNELETGPDPTDPMSYRCWPFCYRWQPGYGPTIDVDAESFPAGTLKIYYAATMEADRWQPPLTAMGFAFESELGSGLEYADAPAPFNAQQIVYPHFAGVGSSAVDLGSSGALPQIQLEVRGKWGIYPSGDADFADMIEDIFKSGLAQAAIGSETATTQMERGLSSYDLPGCIQKKMDSSATAALPAMLYDMPNTARNPLVVVATGAGALSISSSAGETWTALYSSGLGHQVWTATASGGQNTVTISGASAPWSAAILEIGGCNGIDFTGIVTPVGNVTVSGLYMPEFLLAIPFYAGSDAPTGASMAKWDPVTAPNFYGETPSTFQLHGRIAHAPGDYAFLPPGDVTGVAMLSFKSSNPASYPAPLGDFIDLPSLDQVRAQCRANGLYGSLNMNSQSAASDWLKTLYQAANAAPVYLGSKLYSFPYSEVSAAGNGAMYTAPTAAGPVANLDAANGDFVGTDGCPKLTTGSRIRLPNVLQMQCLSREDNYNQVVVKQPDAAAIALYGVREADPIVNNAVQDASIARALLGIQARRNSLGGDSYAFTASPRWILLAPMDLITITDAEQGISKLPVRLAEFNEQDDGSFEAKAEPFVYGSYAPSPLAASSPTPNSPSTALTAGDVNPPVIFEATPSLSGLPSQGELWIAVSSPSAQYGGCQIYISTDGGDGYVPAGGPLVGSAVTGLTTADWPAASDPDTVHNLAVDLTESNGELLSYAAASRDGFLYPCYLAGGGSPIPYELLAYNTATLTAANKYNLMATGSGNELRRGVFGAPAGAVGVDHPSGSRFAFLPPSAAGILKLPMPVQWIGIELYFKVISFNTFGAAAQSLTDVTAYTYTPTGTAGTGAGSVFLVNGS
jgi:hypothetical protein